MLKDLMKVVIVTCMIVLTISAVGSSVSVAPSEASPYSAIKSDHSLLYTFFIDETNEKKVGRQPNFNSKIGDAKVAFIVFPRSTTHYHELPVKQRQNTILRFERFLALLI